MYAKRAAGTRRITVDLSGKLAADEALTGTATVEERYTSALTISGVEFTNTQRSIAGVPATPSRAVHFLVSGGVAGTEYTIRISVATSEQSLIEDIQLRVN